MPDERGYWDIFLENVGLSEGDKTYDQDEGSWDTDAAIDNVKYPQVGTTPLNSPGLTIFKKGKTPEVYEVKQ